LSTIGCAPQSPRAFWVYVRLERQTAEAAEDRGGLRIRAQLLTYLKLSGIKVGLLINLNVLHLKDGLKRMVNKLEPSASLCALRGEADD
jgi:hypothetical protein